MKWRNTLLPFLALFVAVTATNVVVYRAGRCVICSEMDRVMQLLDRILEGFNLRELRPCDGSKRCCLYQLVKSIKRLLLYVDGRCSECRLVDVLRELKQVLQIHLNDGSDYDPLPWAGGDDCVLCLIRDIKEILIEVIYQRVNVRTDDLDCGSHRCAVAKLLALLKIFVKDLIQLLSNPPTDAFCDTDDWSCILRILKSRASESRGQRPCENCRDYSCEQCRRDNSCIYCNNHYSCGEICAK